MRSSWKLSVFEHFSMRDSFLVKVRSANLTDMKMFSKKTVLFSELLSKKLSVYNGLKYVSIFLKNEMLGASLGSFILTKRITSSIHSKTKRNRKGKMKKKK